MAAGEIELFPQRQYTPEVHRLLQVSANLYEATSKAGDPHPELPTAFRPVFTNTGSAIFISGFVEVENAEFLDNPWLDLDLAADRESLKNDVIRSNANVFGQPIIIGARKGFPTFNKLILQTTAGIKRRLVIRKPSPWAPPDQTNQAHIVSITNRWSVEAWNSYRQPFSREVEVRTSLRSAVSINHLTGHGMSPLLSAEMISTNSEVSSSWPGFPQDASFKILLETNHVVIPDSYYVHEPPFLVSSLTNVWEQPLDPFYLQMMAKSRFFYALIDRQTRRVLDFGI